MLTIMNSLETVLRNPKIALYLFGCGLYIKVGNPHEMVSDNPHLDISLDPFHVHGGDRCIIDRHILIPDQDWLDHPEKANFHHVSKAFAECIKQIYELTNKHSLDEQTPQVDLVKTHARMTSKDALKFDLILAGTVLEMKYKYECDEFLEKHIDSGLAEYLIDEAYKAHLHPMYPTYAVPAVTFKASRTDAFIPCNLFNRYGEYIGNQEIEVETLAITGIVEGIIPTLGLSPSFEKFQKEYESSLKE